MLLAAVAAGFQPARLAAAVQPVQLAWVRGAAAAQAEITGGLEAVAAAVQPGLPAQVRMVVRAGRIPRQVLRVGVGAALMQGRLPPGPSAVARTALVVPVEMAPADQAEVQVERQGLAGPLAMAVSGLSAGVVAVAAVKAPADQRETAEQAAHRLLLRGPRLALAAAAVAAGTLKLPARETQAAVLALVMAAAAAVRGTTKMLAV